MTDKGSIYRALPLLGGRPLVDQQKPHHFRPYQPTNWGAMQRYTRWAASPLKLWPECNGWDPTFPSDSSQLSNSGSFFYPLSARFTVFE